MRRQKNKGHKRKERCDMKKACMVLLLFLAFPRFAAADMLGAGAPDFSLKDLEGNSVSLSALQGRVVMLIHFNTYCHTCREEVPLINQIQQNYKDLKIIGIAIGNDNEEAIAFKKDFRPAYVVVPDPQKDVYEKYFVHAVPLIDIVDRTGTIRYRGKLPGEAELKSVMEKVIEEKEVVGADLWNKPPDFTLATTAGETFRLHDIIGEKTVLLTFTSVRSETMRQVIEIMKTLYSRYKREDLDIVRIAVRDSLEDVQKFKKKYYVNFPILVDGKGRVADSYGATQLPKTFIINKKGKIRYISDQASLENLQSILTKIKSYFREDLPEELIVEYLKKAAPGATKFDRIGLGGGQVAYVGSLPNNEKILVREVFRDVLCDVCTNVHFVYTFDETGTIKSIVLIESIDLYGVPIEAKGFLQRVIEKANQKLPLKLRRDIDALTGATQSCKLILEGLNETPEILNSFAAYRDALGTTQR
jgi:peroxiredoxin